MKYPTYCLIAVSLFAVGCQSGNSEKTKKTDQESYEKAMEKLAEKEKKNPASFLKVTSRDKHNLIGQTVIKGEISNEAKICTYKDVQLELSFFSKTGALLEKDRETIYESIAPGKSADFKSKYFAAKGTDSVGIRILSATPLDK